MVSLEVEVRYLVFTEGVIPSPYFYFIRYPCHLFPALCLRQPFVCFGHEEVMRLKPPSLLFFYPCLVRVKLILFIGVFPWSIPIRCSREPWHSTIPRACRPMTHSYAFVEIYCNGWPTIDNLQLILALNSVYSCSLD